MTTAVSEPSVVVADETTAGVADVERWGEVARQTLLDEGVEVGHLDLLFVEPAAIRALNAEHLGVDRPTDVLAFPLDGPQRPSGGGRGGGIPVHLGDIVVCPSVAREQAAGHTGSIEAELTLLIVHGVLHVLGHDHAEPDETVEMQGRERHHLARHGFTHPVAS